MALLITFFLVSIVFSFLCSIWEAVLLSVTPAYVQIQLQSGSDTGKLLNKYKENIDRPLAAILTLNTIAHTVGAIGVGVQASKIWGESIMSTAVIPVAMTLAILILSEIIPKTIGANYWNSLAPITAKSINALIYILLPLVWFSQFITRKLKKDKSMSVLSRSDFTAMAKAAEDSGVIHPAESQIMRNLLKFNSIRSKDIMTPRTVVLAASEEMTIQDFFKDHPNLRFSRIPLYTNSKDHIHGFFLKDDMLTAIINNEGDKTLLEISREIQIVSEGIGLMKLFDLLMEGRNHIALVVDDFGGMSGIVTMEDIIETLIGMEIVDEFDNITDMQALARIKWEERAKKLGIIPDVRQDQNTKT